jgi:hypothetical protein
MTLASCKVFPVTPIEFRSCVERSVSKSWQGEKGELGENTVVSIRPVQ